MKILVFGAALAVSQAVFAQAPVAVASAIDISNPTAVPAPILLWDKVEAGMTRAAVAQLYPAGNAVYHKDNRIEIHGVRISDKCEAESNIVFVNDVVDKVIVKGDPSMGGRCSDTVLTGLAAKYGEPLSREKNKGSILAREGKVYVWRKSAVTMRFKRFSNGPFGGGGLGAASWELTYTRIADNLAL